MKKLYELITSKKIDIDLNHILSEFSEDDLLYEINDHSSDSNTALHILVATMVKTKQSKMSIEYQTVLRNRLNILIERGADLNLRNTKGNTPLIIVSQFVFSKYALCVLDILIKAGANPNIQNNKGKTALMYAVEKCSTTSSIKAVKKLLKAGSNIEARCDSDFTPLIYAAKFCSSTSCPKAIKILIDAGANPNVVTKKDSWTPLHYIAKHANNKRSIEAMNILIKNDADVNAVTKLNKMTPFQYTVRYSNATSSLMAVKFLLDNEDVLEYEMKIQSSLYYAASNSNRDSSIDTINLLLDIGIVPNICTINRCIELWNTTSSLEAVQLMIERWVYDKSKVPLILNRAGKVGIKGKIQEFIDHKLSLIVSSEEELVDIDSDEKISDTTESDDHIMGKTDKKGKFKIVRRLSKSKSLHKYQMK